MVEESKPSVVWTNQAARSFREAFEYILERSVSGADKFKKGIEAIADSLPSNPEKYLLINLRKITRETTEHLTNTPTESRIG